MSDFDEEAERERLREQYERDQKKREATEKMSDLLLKGATMTNAHCQECGDPIFRYDGREFCPTCQRIVADDAGADHEHADDAGAEGDDATDETGAGDADGTAADVDAGVGRGPGDGTGETADAGAAGETANGDDPHIEVKSPSGPPATTADAVEGTADPAPEGQSEGPDSPADGASARTDPAGTAAGGGGGSDPDTRAADASRPAAPETPRGRGEASLSAARESLVRTLTTQARRAESCEDPRQARDHLEAAREAAETLAALSS